MKNKKIAFLGGIYPDNCETIISDSYKSLDFAADAYQKKYLSTLKNIGYKEIIIFNKIFIGSWPLRYKKIIVDEEFCCKYGKIISIKFFNCIFFRRNSMYNNVIKNIKQWYDEHIQNTNLLLFVYSSGFSKEVIKLRQLCPMLKICFIIPDLPQFTYLSDNSYFRKKIINKRVVEFKKALNVVDVCIGITDYMKIFLEKQTKSKCYVIEGIANLERCKKNLINLEIDYNNRYNKKENKIVYTGTLAKKYGVLDLIDAFIKLNRKDCSLIICGGGDAEQEIKELANQYKNIVFKGKIPNSISKEIQNNADILINPRKATDEYTKYSFPSKTIEYLETGKSVIAYKLPGIPEVYNELIYYVENDLKSCIEKVLNLDYESKYKKGKNNLKFLIEKKSGLYLKDVLENIK